MNKKEKGVSLIITFFVLVIVLAVVLSVSTIIYSEIKIIRNIGDSVVAFYAADSGVEKVLYYDRKIIPVDEGGKPAGRGLCFMAAENNGQSCANFESDPALNCLNFNARALDEGGPEAPQGCDPAVCNNCEITFSTNFSDNKNYQIKAAILPQTDLEGNEFLELKIDSLGSYNSVIGSNAVKRSVELKFATADASSLLPQIKGSVVPVNTESGQIVYISAEITPWDPQSQIDTESEQRPQVNLKGYRNGSLILSKTFFLTHEPGSNNFYFSYATNVVAVFTANIFACDIEGRCTSKIIQSAVSE